MTFAVALLCLITLFMLAGVLPAPGGTQAVVFRTPVFILLLTALCGSLLQCCVGRAKRWRRPGFVLTHVGVVVILAGAFTGFAIGKRSEFALPIGVNHMVEEIPAPGEKTYKLGFSFMVRDFSVDFYEPRYGLYRPPSAAEEEYQLESEYAVAKGVLDVTGHVQLPTDELKDAATGEWRKQHVLEDGRILQLVPPTPRRFAATLGLRSGTGETRDVELAVNSPVDYGGWRFYLMSYDKEARRYIVLSARRDPGRAAVIMGIWAVIVGTFLQCWRRGGGHTHAAA